VGLAIFFLAQLTLDAGRARIAARPERKSALLAWLGGAWLVVRHPVHAVAIGLAGLAAGPVSALAVMALRERLPAGPRWALVAAVVLAQVAAAAVGWGRAVRLAGLTRLAGGHSFRERPAERTK
jgi:predicted membrane protein